MSQKEAFTCAAIPESVEISGDFWRLTGREGVAEIAGIAEIAVIAAIGKPKAALAADLYANVANGAENLKTRIQNCLRIHQG
jgi:hypothetical protein